MFIVALRQAGFYLLWPAAEAAESAAKTFVCTLPLSKTATNLLNFFKEGGRGNILCLKTRILQVKKQKVF